MAESPIFLDPSGRRRRVAAAVTGALFVVALAVAAMLVVVTFLFGPQLPKLRVTHRSTTYQDPLTIDRKGTTVLAPRLRRLLAADIRKAAVAGVKKPQDRIVLGYYAPYESSGVDSLREHANALTHVAPEWLHLSADGKSIDYRRDYDPKLNPRTATVETLARRAGLRILPILDNYGKDRFDPALSKPLLRDPALQAKLAQELAAFLVAHHYDGIHLDLEELDGTDSKGYIQFANALHKAFAPRGLSVSAAVEPGNDELDFAAMAEPCDFIVPMLYDQHSADSEAGPVAALEWSQSNLAHVLETVPESKIVMGVGNFGYDWIQGQKRGVDLTFQDALTTADGYRDESPDKVLRFDPDNSNTTFAYRDDDDKLHRVWYLDAVSAYNQLLSAGDLGLRGAALWQLGSEDPALWSFFNRDRLFKRVDPKALERISFDYEVSFQGRGEILDVQSRARNGERQIAMDKEGFVDTCRTLSYASPFVVAKSGYVPRKLALTFDDGPDRQWTPAILDELKRLGVPGTFFDIGANVESMPDLVSREYDEGHEIGNHSFTHPDLGAVSDARARAEITLTQIAIQGATGHSSVLFRPPYNADSEPETPDQLAPVLIADALDYITVGENVDPLDWNPTIETPKGSRPRTAEDISNAVLEDLKRRKGGDDEGNIILLHDAGGDRSQTVKALGMMIPKLKAEGYEFVTVSSLIGKTRDGVMPPLSAGDRLNYMLGRFGLGAAFKTVAFLAVAFTVAIVLGLARTALVVPLALAQRRKEGIPTGSYGTISVVIAGYNEVAVIARTVESVLASEADLLEIIVVDDGSTDGTAEAVPKHPKVRVLSKLNGGKASALNEGIALATGDLLFHIDADTILEPHAIGRLAAHFSDPKVAAVAGNVQVGNRINLLTKWQDLEYITSQNLDRRAYARLNCITVVPGAIGMWRRDAVLAAGGYQTDTLAEDMDLTWRLRRAEWRLENEPRAYAYTEAPERFGPFFKQRFRWAYGTLQCLWKHRGALGRHGWFGGLALPVQWLFGVVFQALAPLIDLEVLVTLADFTTTLSSPGGENHAEAVAKATANLQHVAILYAVFMVAEMLGAAVALRMERKPLWRLFPLLLQRFAYRQLMYAVMFRSLVRAVAGGAAGWGKLARTGTVRVPPAKEGR